MMSSSLSEIESGGRQKEVELGQVERRVETPGLAGLETVSLGVG